MEADRQTRVLFSDPQIEMAHGAGGKATRRLLEGLVLPLLHNPTLEKLGDSALVDLDGTSLAFTADSFVVRPLSFPGGSIGKLAINGTVNDLAVAGARPAFILVNFVLEEGLPGPLLRQEIEAVAAAALEADVQIVGGDTKVVEHGKGDGIYVTTAGIGCLDNRVQLDPQKVQIGDQILLSGPIGDHGVTILLARGELDLEAELVSDSRAVTRMVQALIDSSAAGIRWMRDPTRGGVASSLNELARDCRLNITIFEDQIPMRDSVRGACEILGLEPLHIANEGQFLAVVAQEHAETALEALRQSPGGNQAARIGEVRESPSHRVLSMTPYGGRRIVDMLVGDPLPRIC